MENQQITHEDLLWEALQLIEMALKDKLHYLGVNKFKAYVKKKKTDAKRAFDMTRKTVPSDIPDEKLKRLVTISVSVSVSWTASIRP